MKTYLSVQDIQALAVVAAKRNSSRPAMSGVRIDVGQDNRTRLWATDAHIFAALRSWIEPEDSDVWRGSGVTLPAEAVKAVKALPKTGIVKLSVDEKHWIRLTIDGGAYLVWEGLEETHRYPSLALLLKRALASIEGQRAGDPVAPDNFDPQLLARLDRSARIAHNAKPSANCRFYLHQQGNDGMAVAVWGGPSVTRWVGGIMPIRDKEIPSVKTAIESVINGYD